MKPNLYLSVLTFIYSSFWLRLNHYTSVLQANVRKLRPNMTELLWVLHKFILKLAGTISTAELFDLYNGEKKPNVMYLR